MKINGKEIEVKERSAWYYIFFSLNNVYFNGDINIFIRIIGIICLLGSPAVMLILHPIIIACNKDKIINKILKDHLGEEL